MKINRNQLVKVIQFWQDSLKRDSLCSRDVLKKIDFKSREVIDLIGPRRSGKSSILKLIIQQLGLKEGQYLYINFEDPFFVENNNPQILEELISVFREFFGADLKYLFLDEIQEIKGWEKAIRKLRDGEPFKIFLTGSSSKLLSKELSSLLTGRHLTYQILPLSFEEFLRFRKMEIKTKKDLVTKEEKVRKEFLNYLNLGGFPQPVLDQNQQLLKNYFSDILQKDIMVRYEIREKEILEKIAIYALSNLAKLVSIESLKLTYNISYALASAYLEYLEEAFLIFTLPQFSYSLKKQHKAFKKIYSIDSGLSNAISFKFSEDKGRYLENVVFLELKRRFDEIYYYKTKNNLEVDFLIREKQKPKQLIQVAWELIDEKTKKREVGNLVAAMEETGLKEGLILTNDEEEIVSIDKKTIKIQPVYSWLLEKQTN